MIKGFIQKFVKTCPKTGRFRGIKPLKGLTHLLFPVIGIVALLWILFRVIPKPSRINYPCVKAAMPFAAGFIESVIFFIVSVIAFIKLKKSFFKYDFIFAALFVTLTIGAVSYFDRSSTQDQPQFVTIYQNPNEPIGEAQGIFPGRVVWVHNADATNENCNPKSYGHSWFNSENSNQDVIDEMVSSAIKSLTGEENDSSAWNAIFKYHNNLMGKGEVDYTQGEKIFIKINATSGWSGNFNPWDLSITNSSYFGISETSPQIILSVLRQLVNVVGISQSDIYIGDPMKHIYKHMYDILHPEFPDVHYLDHDGYTNLGREKAAVDDSATIFYSDRGTILRTNVWSNGQPGDEPVYKDTLYKIFEDAEYLISIPQLKGHKRAGVTMFAKNHLGSQTRINASHMHNGLVAPTEPPDTSRTGYGLYRVQVDLMGHYLLGKKNLLYLMDALWATDYELDIPLKWQMPPFNNDYTSSVFASLDPVAIESVGYDFLRSEFTEERGAGTYVQMNGVDDYLHQAADSSNWAESIIYDPENDGISIGRSLGVHEHWNNPVDMQYSRNLGTDDGIELFASPIVSVENINSEIPSEFMLYPNFPNPFNPSTTIRFDMKEGNNVKLLVYDLSGKLVDIIFNEEYKPAGTYEVKYNAERLSSGVYFVLMDAGKYKSSLKIILLK